MPTRTHTVVHKVNNGGTLVPQLSYQPLIAALVGSSTFSGLPWGFGNFTKPLAELPLACGRASLVDKTHCHLQNPRENPPSKTTMYIHMFAFRYKAGVSEEQKNRVLDEVRKLQIEIPVVLECWVGKNISPRGQGYELGGVMKFADKATFDGYVAHPAHQKLLSWLVPLIEPIEVDFPSTYARH